MSTVQVELANGRRVRMSITPAPASAAGVNGLRRKIAADERWQVRATTADATAIRELAAAQVAAFKKLTEQQLAGDRALAERLARGDRRIDARIGKELANGRAADAKPARHVRNALAHTQRRALWNSVLLASGLPFFAAYGDVADPFSRDNLTLTGSLAGWLLADEILDGLIGRGTKPDGLWRSGTNLLSYLAPVGNGLTAYGLLDEHQHTRFLTGITRIRVSTVEPVVTTDEDTEGDPQAASGGSEEESGGSEMLEAPTEPSDSSELVVYAAVESEKGAVQHEGDGVVELRVAHGYADTFASLAAESRVSAVASLVDVNGFGGKVLGVTAQVGKQENAVILTLKLVFGDVSQAKPGVEPIDVAWMVDTQAPKP